jgi:hypothetical protein
MYMMDEQQENVRLCGRDGEKTNDLTNAKVNLFI